MTQRKGIILAGGYGTRLYPLTLAVSKQLLPIYDKPMIYYPLSMLMLSGIREILIISTPHNIQNFENLFGNGSRLGLKFSYKIQPSPDGIAQAFILGETFIRDDDVCLVLGDNIFYGASLPKKLKEAVKTVNRTRCGVVFGYSVSDPERYGVVEFNNQGGVVSIEEKPKAPKSKYAISGLYYYPNEVIDIVKNQTPSERGELEITDTNIAFLKKNKLKVVTLGRGYAWLDTGTYDSLLEASQFVATLEKRQGIKVSCVEEISYRLGYINEVQLEKLGNETPNNDYGKYLLNISRNDF